MGLLLKIPTQIIQLSLEMKFYLLIILFPLKELTINKNKVEILFNQIMYYHLEKIVNLKSVLEETIRLF